eukprot:gene8592-biopygen15178
MWEVPPGVNPDVRVVGHLFWGVFWGPTQRRRFWKDPVHSFENPRQRFSNKCIRMIKPSSRYIPPEHEQLHVELVIWPSPGLIVRNPGHVERIGKSLHYEAIGQSLGDLKRFWRLNDIAEWGERLSWGSGSPWILLGLYGFPMILQGPPRHVSVGTAEQQVVRYVTLPACIVLATLY